jgi:hypothetical protein
MSVTRICFDVGFASLGTFTRHFAGDVGMPPQRLRRFALHPPAIDPLLAPRAPAEPAGVLAPAAPGAAIQGVAEAPEGFRGPIFVGVFPEPIPRGRPAACAVLEGPGEFSVGPLPDGRWHVLAAGPGEAAEAAGLLHEAALRGAAGPVSVRGGRAAGRVSILLRPPRPVDPPILAPLAVLLATS